MGSLSALAPDASAAAGQEIRVNTPKDLVNGTDGRCSLREALDAAATGARSGDVNGECSAGGAGQDVIQLKGDTTYKLSRDGAGDEDANADGDLDVVTGSVKIRGGRRTVIVQQDGDQRVIDVHTASLALHRIVITGGHAQPDGDGGGIRNVGTLALWKCTVSGNSAGPAVRSTDIGGHGGGIYNRGTLVLDFTKVANNAAGDGANNNSVFSSGASPGGSGGGIFNAGTASIENSRLLNNRAGEGGHGTSSGVTAGTGGSDGGSGGAIASSGMATIQRSTLAGNRAGDGGDGGRGGQTLSGEGLDGAYGGHGGSGGAVGAQMITILDSTISGNRSGEGGRGGPGGVGSPSGGQGDDGLHGWGGGLGIGGDSTLANVTISGNTSRGAGGGIASNDGVHLNNVTIAGNTAPGGEGGGVFNNFGVLSLTNTLIADNDAALANDCSGTLDADAYNLIESPAGCTGVGSTDITRVDPRLGPLDANGGPTKTHALRRGSPAINAGDPNPLDVFSCTTNDQRGKTRDDCDIGAYERM